MVHRKLRSTICTTIATTGQAGTHTWGKTCAEYPLQRRQFASSWKACIYIDIYIEGVMEVVVLFLLFLGAAAAAVDDVGDG